MLIRFRTQLGVWKLKDIDASSSLQSQLQRLEIEYKTDLDNRPIYLDAQYTNELNKDLTISELIAKTHIVDLK